MFNVYKHYADTFEDVTAENAVHQTLKYSIGMNILTGIFIQVIIIYVNSCLIKATYKVSQILYIIYECIILRVEIAV